MISLAAALLGLGTLVAPQAGGGVEGVIRSSDGDRPLPYAQVLVVGDSIADWTDERGTYHLEGLARGEWQVRVVHPGHEPLDVAVVVAGDRTIRLDVTLEARPGPRVDALADFEPFTVDYTLPALENGPAMTELMRDLYPAELARQRIGGEAVLRLWLDERGRVVRSLISESSGQPALDSIALTVSERMRFRPAKQGAEGMRVIVRIPILFRVPEVLEPLEGGAG